MLTEKQLREIISRCLRPLRDDKKWSQDRLAKEAGLTTVGYGEIERGNTTPSIYSLYRISQALDCRLDDILPLVALKEAALANADLEEAELAEIAEVEAGIPEPPDEAAGNI